MKKENQKKFYAGIGFVAAFILWTVLVCTWDVKPIGPQGSSVGFATVNQFVHKLTGVHFPLYVLTDWLGFVPVCTVLSFAALVLVQWIKRKSLRKVDGSLFILGAFYLVVVLLYILFEYVIINYRPVMIEGIAEASYPSSTTLLVMCVMPTAAVQLHGRIKRNVFRKCIDIAIAVFVVFMVVGRFLSGVHWLSDIIGGALLSTGLVMLYDVCCKRIVD